MNKSVRADSLPEEIDPGLFAVCGIAGFYRIGSDPGVLKRELSLCGRRSDASDLVRATRFLGLKSKLATKVDRRRFSLLPLPAIVRTKSGAFSVLVARSQAGLYRLVDPVTKITRDFDLDALMEELEPIAVLATRRFAGEGRDPTTFGLSWFLPSLWRYRKPLSNVLLASLFVQIFALTTPIFFQIVVDKVLTHKTYSTLYVLAAGMGLVGLFDVVLQYLRTYVLSHTTNRIDVELGRRLFRHLTRLPISYFETRAAGQTVARVRELESIRSFLTGQALFSALDFVFAFVFIGVLFAYSWKLASIVVVSAPVYLIIGFLVRPPLRRRVKEKFDRGAASQQFLVETIVGMQTVKASAVEPAMQSQWEERLAAYVKTSFHASMLAALGQNLIQYVSKFTNVLILLFGAYAVMNGELSVGALVAFNMIAAQTIAPLLRLSQLWQDFQQVQVSVDRLGDILNHPPERAAPAAVSLPRPRGDIELSHVTFRYKPGGRDVLTDISLNIRAGEVVGIVGPSGSGKSTLSKLIQRMYVPESGRIAVDGIDISQVDPSWLRGHIGVVLQDSLLFNRTIHDNIAFANPAMPRTQVMAVARLTGADEFIAQLPEGYDTLVEERGANLSGGQRQRIAIARALVTNPSILIFDEATSALDYESEQLIQKNMEKIVQNRTVVMIAHRLAAVRGCHRIFGIQDGRLVEAGSHAELLARKGGLYARLWALQTEGAAA